MGDDLGATEVAGGTVGAALEVDGVTVRFGGLTALEDVSLTASAGEVVGVIGPNGAGKTTLFNVLTGFYRADRGEVLFDGRSIFRRPAHRIARLGMVRTFQITKVLAAMSVLDNMLLAAPRQPGEHIATLVATPGMAPDTRLDSALTHYSVLRTIEDAWGMAALGAAADASPIAVTP